MQPGSHYAQGQSGVQGPVTDLRPAGNAVKVLTGNQSRALEVLRGLVGPRGVTDDEEYLVVQAGEDVVPEIVRRL